MEIEKMDGALERRICIGMIVDNVFLGRVESKWTKEGLLKNEWANMVGAWCVKYFRKYGKAPRKQIQGMFESWASESQDNATVELVERFLSSISDEYKTLAKESNSDYITDLAAKHFNKVLVLRTADKMQGFVNNGDVDKAWSAHANALKLEIGAGAGIDVMRDENAIREAFERSNEVLIELPGDIGKFFGKSLERDGFIAALGPEKRGKTFILMNLAWYAMLQRRKVAFFAVGDMSQNQMMRRFMTRAAKRPLRSGVVRIPKSISFDGDTKKIVVEHVEKEFKDALDWREAYKACKEVIEVKAKSKQALLKLSCHPNSSINVNGINGILQTWEREDWTPDVVVIDYADILAPPFGVADTRDQINMTWKQLRSLSQARHCLVVTATQADAASYSADTLDMSNFSEDKRKFAHVTGMFGLNATKEEKEQGVIRLNWIVRREEEYNMHRCCWCAGELAIGNPFIKSKF